MAAVTISMVIKITILLAAFVTVYTSIYGYVNNAKETSYYLQMKDIGEYVQEKALYALETTSVYGKNSTHLIKLPYLNFFYSVELSCDDYFVVNVSADVISRRFESRDFMNCSNINASGKVMAGEKCLITEKVNQTYYNIKLVNNCGL